MVHRPPADDGFHPEEKAGFFKSRTQSHVHRHRSHEITALMEVDARFHAKDTSAAGFPRIQEFIIIAHQRIRDHIEEQSSCRCQDCPEEYMAPVIGLCDLSQPVGQ